MTGNGPVSTGAIVRKSHSRTIIWFGSFFDCSAPPKKKGDLSKIAGWLNQERHGTLWALLGPN